MSCRACRRRADVEAWSGKDRGDENFPVGSALIRARLRPHVHAFYAFARNADDIADSPVLAADEKIARLDVMEEVLIGRRAAGSAECDRTARSPGRDRRDGAHSRELLVAFRRDATKNRYADWDELMDYCRYSAMPVGRHVLDLHGESRGDLGRPSDALCTSLQVLNHLQDCAKDLSDLDRCYLPLDLLTAHGVAVDDVRGAAATPGLRRVFDALLDRCDALNRDAPMLPRRTRDGGCGWRRR